MISERFKTVTRCVCHDRTFEEIASLMEKEGAKTVREVIDNDWAGGGCGMCLPYVSNMIRTGEVAFTPGDIDPYFDDY